MHLKCETSKEIMQRQKDIIDESINRILLHPETLDKEPHIKEQIAAMQVCSLLFERKIKKL